MFKQQFHYVNMNLFI